jgi:hypothetical protein
VSRKEAEMSSLSASSTVYDFTDRELPLTVRLSSPNRAVCNHGGNHNEERHKCQQCPESFASELIVHREQPHRPPIAPSLFDFILTIPPQ